ncbi:protein amalgam-like [Glandiceps talaboti]
MKTPGNVHLIVLVGKLLMCTVSIEVTAIYTETPRDTIVVLGDSTQFNCTFVTKSAHLYEWNKDSIRIANGDVLTGFGPGTYELDSYDDVYNIRIHDTTIDDEGTYQCNDAGSLENAKANLYVAVLHSVMTVDPHELYVSSDTDGYAIEDGDFYAFCEITEPGNPQDVDDTYWIFDGEILPQHEDTLQIQQINRSQAGKYTCVKTNTLYNGDTGYGSASISVNVEYTPMIIYAPDFVEAKTGNEVEINCTADAVPTASIVWYELSDNVTQEIKPDNHRDIKISYADGTLITSTFTIYSVTSSDYGTYMCNASNWIPPGDARRIEVCAGKPSN